jgi:hypothetical protein
VAVLSAVESALGSGAVPGSSESGGRESSGGAVRNLRGTRQYPSDDEILGLGVRTRSRLTTAEETADGDTLISPNESLVHELEHESQASDQGPDLGVSRDPETYREIFEKNPELRKTWEAVQAFRESFATPEEARSATKSLADLRTIDTLFFSERPEDHTELVRLVAQADPGSFGSLVKAMTKLATERGRIANSTDSLTPARDSSAAGRQEAAQTGTLDAGRNGPQREQEQPLYIANSEAVKGVLAAIESQADRLLPENAATGARKRVVGEIYHELDQALQANDQLAKQIRGALRSGNLDARHRSAVVSLIVNRARQTLPSVAKRVLTEWTSTILASSQDRKERQRSAESRVDIAGARTAENDGARIRSPRNIDYTRLSDSDILNL